MTDISKTDDFKSRKWYTSNLNAPREILEPNKIQSISFNPSMTACPPVGII